MTVAVRPLYLATLIVLTAPLTAVRAENGPTAEQLLDRAVHLYNQGDVAASTAALEQAEQQTTEPAVRARIFGLLGVNSFVQNNHAQARAHFAKALRDDPALRLDPNEIPEPIVDLLNEIREECRGTLGVTSAEPGSAVTIDGKTRGKAPCEVVVGIGARTVTLRAADGRRTCTQEVVVRPDTKVEVTCTLPPPPRPQPTPAATEPDTSPRPDLSEPRNPRQTYRVAAWATAGLAVAAVTAGAVWMTQRREKGTLVEEDGVARLLADDDPIWPPALLFASGGAAAVASGVLFYLGYRAETVTPVATVGQTSALVGLRGRF